MEKCFVVHSSSLGDTICSTPTLKKLSKSYGEKFHVATHLPEVFSNNPYVKKIIDIDSVNEENYEIFETFRKAGRKDKNGIEKKHNTIDIRQFHAMDLGFGLLPEEMECKFYPDIYEDLRLPSDYICIHPTQTWESRTWAKEKWQELVNELIRMGVCVVLVGKDSQEFGFWNIKKPTFDIRGGAEVINLLNKTNLSSTWNVINNASCFITMDSGLLHLAGTTDTHIIQLGSSINYKLRAPYRKGSQDYKYNYIGGTCDIFCGSDMKYGIKEWGTIHGVPPIIGCLEDKPTYECHPSVDQVIDRLSKNNIKIFKNRVGNFNFENFIKPYKEEIGIKTARYKFYSYAIPKLVEKKRPIFVLETGSMHGRDSGSFTLVLSDLIKNWTGGKLYTVDISENNLNKCKKLTKKFTDVIEYVHSDSIQYIKEVAGKINYDLVYFDSFDLNVTDPLPSSNHHLSELKAVYDYLAEDTIIAVDDNYSPGTMIYWNWFSDDKSGVKEVDTKDKVMGKGAFIDLFLTEKKWTRHREFDEPNQNNLYCYEKDVRKKILYLAPHLSTGGSPEWLRKAIESIKDDFEVFVVEFSFYSTEHTVQRKEIIKMVGEDKFYSLGSVFDEGETHVLNRWSLMDIINEIQPNVVHINEMPEMFEYKGFPNEILDELYGENRSYQVYETSHCSTYEPDKQKRYIPDGFIHCSPLLLKQYKNFDVPQYLVEYPVEKKERPNRKKILEELGLDPSKKHVLQVGLFTHLKNQKYTFELASATQDLNIQYHFVGNQCWKDNCNILEEYFSLPNCKIWGERSDVDVFMSCMDILIFPSLIELNPIVLKEADSWDMKILLNSLSAYGDTYEENQNVINLKLDVDKDKKAIQYAHMYCPKDGNDGNSRSFLLWEEIIETQIYEKKFKVKEGDIVLDIGANVGYFAVSCSQRNINRCYCFEPMERNFEYLQKNINNLIDCEKFELINKAISPNPEIYIPSGVDQDTPHAISVLERLPNSFSPYAVEEKEDGCLVIPAIKLSDFLEENKIEKIDFLKMDIEGGEWDIFEDAKEFEALLSKTEKFVAEIHVKLGTSIETKFKKDFIEKFKNSGFEISMTSVDGFDATDAITNNYYLSDQKKKAHDYYQQFIFYAWKK